MPVIPQAIRTRLHRPSARPMAVRTDTTSPTSALSRVVTASPITRRIRTHTGNGTSTTAPRRTTAKGTPRRAMPVAVRLVATYGLIVAATLLVVAGVAYDLTRHQLATDLDARLESTVGSFERGALRNLPPPG